MIEQNEIEKHHLEYVKDATELKTINELIIKTKNGDFKSLQKLKNMDNAIVQYTLGLLFKYGSQGIEKDVSVSTNYFKLSSEQNFLPSIGILFFN
jgi:TPR repeat protein